MDDASWNSSRGYVWAMVGSAVGIANILGFSSKCYMNGGGAFLIPLLAAFVTLGIPLLVLEGVVGSHLRAPMVTSARKVCGGIGAFLAWPTIIGVWTIGSYYTVINGWILAYTYFSATGHIGSNTEAFFFDDFLQISADPSIWGDFSWTIWGFGFAVCMFTLAVNVKTIDKGIERINGWFLPTLSILLVAMMLGTFFLPGAVDGLALFLLPDFARLNEPSIWLNAFGHVFFSLSVGLGIIIGYSKYTDRQIDIVKSMRMVAFGDLATSLVAGAVVFGGLGHMAHIMDAPVNDIVSSSAFGTGFIVFPKLCQMIPGQAGWLVGLGFFVCLAMAGLSSQVSITETVVANLESEFGWSRRVAVWTVVSVTIATLALYSFGNGLHLIGVIDSMTSGFNVLISGIVQIILFIYVSKKIPAWPGWTSNRDGRILLWVLRVLAPAIIGLVLIVSFEDDLDQVGSVAWSIKWGWFASSLVLAAGLAWLGTRESK